MVIVNSDVGQVSPLYDLWTMRSSSLAAPPPFFPEHAELCSR